MTVPRDVFLPVTAQPSVDTLVDLSQRAENMGYERIWLPETWGRDAVTTLTSIAEQTESIGIGVSIANVYSRSPALLGQTAATLQEVSNGRFRMGVGPSGPIVVEGWHGADFEQPLKRTREAVEIAKTVLRGEGLNYDGDVFQLSGFRLRHTPPEPRPGVDAAGLGPKSVELAGRFADGWHALMLTRDGLRDRLGDFERGVELGDRDRGDQRVTLSLPCCVRADGERARELVRQHVAFYVGGMGTFYRDSLARQGHEETANRIAERWANGDEKGAMAAIDDDLLDELAVAGTPEVCRERLSTFTDIDGVDAVSVSFSRAADPEDIDETLTELAPE